MSFIYDNPWLVNQLLQAGSEFENKFLKRGQATPSAPAEQPVPSALKALLNNLRDQITPLQEGSTQVGQASGGADLSSHNMDSMGDLVEWMAKNGTRIGNQVIVMDGRGERPSEDYGYFKIEPGTEIVVPLARPDRNVRAFWINPTALKNYLVSLQSDPKLKGNVIFQVQLLKLIQDANNQLDLNLSEEYKEPEKTLPDDTRLDDLPNPIDPQSPNQAGNVPLNYGDMKSLQTFSDWAIGKNMTMKVEGGTIAKAGEDGFDQCAFINILAARAKSKFAWRRPNSQQYWAQVQAIAKEANCDISQAGTTPGKEAPGGGAQISPQALQQLASLLPFNSQDINFREIQKFTKLYAQLARRSDITAMAQQIDQSIQYSQQLMRQPSMIVPLQQLKAPNDLSAWHAFAKDGRLADVLFSIVNSAGMAYKDFVNTARHILGDTETLENRQQVDAGGPWSVNMGDINQLRTDIAQEGKYGPNKVYI